MILHVLPVNDLEEHIDSSICKCEPKVLNENGNLIIVHNSYDGREGLEWVEELLNKEPRN